MKNIHILTTLNPSRMLRGFDGIRLFKNEVSPDNQWCVNVNIHITNDEEIKEGDKRINNYQRKPKGEEIPSKKIILTTDQDLIKDGVQAIDDEFLKWFVKNPSCEKVETEKWFDTSHIDLGYGSKVYHNNPNIPLHKIIIPKEEPKQETIEEAYYEKLKQSLIEFRKVPITFVPDERMYSEEEVLKILYEWSMYKIDAAFSDEDVLVYTEWFEQFKKK